MGAMEAGTPYASFSAGSFEFELVGSRESVGGVGVEV